MRRVTARPCRLRTRCLIVKRNVRHLIQTCVWDLMWFQLGDLTFFLYFPFIGRVAKFSTTPWGAESMQWFSYFLNSLIPYVLTSCFLGVRMCGIGKYNWALEWFWNKLVNQDRIHSIHGNCIANQQTTGWQPDTVNPWISIRLAGWGSWVGSTAQRLPEGPRVPPKQRASLQADKAGKPSTSPRFSFEILLFLGSTCWVAGAGTKPALCHP